MPRSLKSSPNGEISPNLVTLNLREKGVKYVRDRSPCPEDLVSQLFAIAPLPMC